MTEENTQESVDAGSSDTSGPENNSGEPKAESKPQITEEMYKELETKLGSQGKELGEYRTFFREISPLLEKLDNQPQLATAIVEGKVTQELAVAVSEGKISLESAQDVAKAHEEVKKEVGKEKLEKMSVEEVEKLITAKVEAVKTDFNKTLNESKSMDEFEAYTKDFIKNTPDFAQYADAINKWFDAHGDVDDIKVAYYAVKGELQSKDDSEKQKADAAKALAANAAGGGSQGGKMPDGSDVVDSLIGGRTNPNVL